MTVLLSFLRAGCCRLALVVLTLAAWPAAAAPPRWADWQQQMYSEPARVLRDVDAVDATEWSAPDRLRLGLLRVRALGELGRADESAPALEALRDEVARSGQAGLQAAWHAYQGDLLRARNQAAEAQPHWERALALAEQAGDHELQSLVQTLRAQAALDDRDIARAAAAVEADRRVSEASGDPQIQARHRYWAASLKQTLEDVPGAVAAFGDAAQRFRALGNRTWESDCLRQLALVLIDAERPAEALEPALRSVALLETLEDAVYLALARSSLAEALLAHGRRDEALANSEHALAVAARAGSANMRANVRITHARLLLRLGRTGEAAAMLKSALPEGETGPSLTTRGHHLRLRAELLSAQGRAEAAAEAWKAVLHFERDRATRQLEEQLQAQGAVLQAQRLQRENDLLQERSRQAERALGAEARARWLTTGAIVLLLGGAGGALLWQRRVNRRIAQLAARDALTGLLNRRSLLEQGAARIETRRRTDHPLAVLLFDVDHFKHINDNHGHAAGDEVLRQVAAALRHGLRQTDLVARWGGEEFLLLLPGTTIDEAAALAERQRLAVAALAMRPRPGAAPLHVTVSAGLSVVTESEPTLDAALERADQALYRAKAGGRNAVATLSPAEANGGASAASDSTSSSTPSIDAFPV